MDNRSGPYLELGDCECLGHILCIEMTQWMKSLVAKPSDLSSIPGTHMVKGEIGLSQVVLWCLHICCGKCVCLCAYVHMQNKWQKTSHPFLVVGSGYETGWKLVHKEMCTNDVDWGGIIDMFHLLCGWYGCWESQIRVLCLHKQSMHWAIPSPGLKLLNLV